MNRPFVHCCAFVLVLCLPGLQMAIGALPGWPLGGVERQEPPTPVAGWQSWHDGTLQEHWRRRFTQQLGLRDWLVRTDNQIRMWLLGECKGDVTSGRDGWLFATEYLPGADLATEVEQRRLLLALANLQRVQALLEARGVTLMLLVSPNKCRLVPEQLPERSRQVVADGSPTLYEFARDWLDAHGVRWFDAHRRFAGWRREGVDFPLFTRGGAHWSAFAAARIAAELVDSLRAAGVPMRGLDVQRGELRVRAGADELDLVEMANLLDERPWHQPTPVPVVRPRDGDATPPIRLLVEGTSFCWAVLPHLAATAAASPLTFQYYLRRRHEWLDGRAQPSTPTAWSADDLPALLAELLSYRVIVIEINELRLPGMGHGLLEGLLMLFGEQPLAEPTPALVDWQRNWQQTGTVRRR